MFLTVGTVKWNLSNIYKKLGVRNRVQAIIKGKELDLIVAAPAHNDDNSSLRFVTYLATTALENPYKGLQAFKLADEKDFFGRTKLTKKLMQRLAENVPYHRFLAILGPSGSGKSSLVHAGLLSAILRQQPAEEAWFIVDLTPGTHPLEKLEVALTRVAADQSANIRDHLERDQRGLLRIADLILPDDAKTELLIVIDQFEEVFTLLEDEQQRAHFLDLIIAAVTDPRSRVRVVITLRADFFDRPLQYPAFGAMLRARMETILPLSAEELEAAITQPAAPLGVTYEAGLVSSIVSDINYQPGALPLLQYALTELFDRREGRVITRAAYEAIGGTIGALARRADILFDEFSAEGRELVRQIFMRLVTLGEGTEDTRRRLPRQALQALSDNAELVDEIIDTYTAYRLLSLDHDPITREPTVEVAHEAILREWERLRGWLNESRGDIKVQRQLSTLSAEWESHQHSLDYLVRGSRLDQLQVWSTDTSLTLTHSEQAFLKASSGERERREAKEQARAEREANLQVRARRVLQGLVAVFLIAAVVAVILALWANGERARAEDEKARAEIAENEALRQASIGLAAQAVAELDSDAPERSVLLALVALDKYLYTSQAERALARAVYNTHRYVNLQSARNRVQNIAFSPNGTYVAATELSIEMWDYMSGERVTELGNIDTSNTQSIRGISWSSDNRILLTSSVKLQIARVWDVESEAELLRYEGHDGAVNNIHISSDDRFALTASSDGTAHIWEVATGQLQQVFDGHQGAVKDAIWSPDDTKIATASDDGTLRVWDVATGNQLLQINAHLGGVTALSWSSDGTRLASAGEDGLGRIWNAGTGELLFTLIGHTAVVRDIEWAPDDTLLATAGGDRRARVWEAVAGNQVLEFAGGDADIVAVDWSRDGHRLAVGGGTGVRVWDVSSSVIQLVGHTGDERGIIMTNWPYWSPDDPWVGTGGLTDNTYRIWDPVSGENLMTFEGVTEGQGSINPGGTEILLVNPERIVNFETGLEHAFPVPEDYVETIGGYWSPDGDHLLIQSGAKYTIYDVQTQDPLFSSSLRCTFNAPLFWSPDGKYLAQTCFSGEFTSILITEALTGRVVQELEGHTDSVIFVDWSPDGLKLATASFDQTVRVWDVNSGETLMVFSGHSAPVFDVDWSPTGMRVASGDTAGNVLIWDTYTGREVNRYNVGGSVIFLEWSPDGTGILTTGVFDAPDIRPVWQSTEELIEYAFECCAFRELTAEEREQFGVLE